MGMKLFANNKIPSNCLLPFTEPENLNSNNFPDLLNKNLQLKFLLVYSYPAYNRIFDRKIAQKKPGI